MVNKKANYIYLFLNWIFLSAVICGFYLAYWDMVVGVIYLKGFFDPSIYTFFFCLITIVMLIIDGTIFLLRPQGGFFSALWHVFSFITYVIALNVLTNTYTHYFLRPSVKLREVYHTWSFISVFVLAVITVAWLILCNKSVLKGKTPIWLTIILLLVTIILFVGFWLFLDVITSL